MDSWQFGQLWASKRCLVIGTKGAGRQTVQCLERRNAPTMMGSVVANQAITLLPLLLVNFRENLFYQESKRIALGTGGALEYCSARVFIRRT